MTQTSTPSSTADRFRRSRRLCWAALSAAIAQSAAVIAWPSPEAAQVTTVVVPAYLALVAGWTGISNWAEVRRPLDPGRGQA